MGVLTKELVVAYSGTAKFDGDNLTMNASLEESVTSIVFGRLQELYDTSVWGSVTTTPTLVKSCIAMIYVGRLYQQIYAQEVGVSDYGTQLINDAEQLLNNIVSGAISLPGVSKVTDLSGIGAQDVTDPKFSMSDVF